MLSQLINTAKQDTVHIDSIRLDGGTQPRQGIDDVYVTELAESMVDGAKLPPVDVMYDGANYWLFDGYHRVAAHRKAGFIVVDATIHQGTQADAQWRSYAANQTHGLRRTNEDKQRAIKAALRHPNGATLADREIARHLGVDHKTVGSWREKLQATGEIPQSTTRTGADGRAIDTSNIGTNQPAAETDEERRQRIRENDRRMKDEINSHVSAGRQPQGDRLWADDLRAIVDAWADESWRGEWPENPSHTNGTFWQQITTWLHKKFDRPWYESDLKFAIKQAAAERRRSQTISHAIDVDVSTAAEAATVQIIEYDADTPLPEWAEEPDDEEPPFVPVSLRDDYDSDEWYTPADYIEAARRAMGSIDLDPATCEMAQTIVQADVYLTKMDNGLAARWLRENVWLNPPYSNSQAWIDKLLREVDGVFVKQAIVLVNNATETAWFQSLLARSTVVCFPGRRLQFWRHDHSNVGARQGQAIFYIGPNDAAFIAEFEQFGTLMRRVM